MTMRSINTQYYTIWIMNGFTNDMADIPQDNDNHKTVYHEIAPLLDLPNADAATFYCFLRVSFTLTQI